MEKRSYILYVEDERTTIELVGMILRPHGYKVRGATSGKQGLVMMRDQKPDLVLLDLMMHDMSGWKLYRELKSDETLADIPVIVLTATAFEEDLKIVEDLPAVDDFLPKPFEPQRLRDAVRKLLEK